MLAAKLSRLDSGIVLHHVCHIDKGPCHTLCLCPCYSNGNATRRHPRGLREPFAIGQLVKPFHEPLRGLPRPKQEQHFQNNISSRILLSIAEDLERHVAREQTGLQRVCARRQDWRQGNYGTGLQKSMASKRHVLLAVLGSALRQRPQGPRKEVDNGEVQLGKMVPPNVDVEGRGGEGRGGEGREERTPNPARALRARCGAMGMRTGILTFFT